MTASDVDERVEAIARDGYTVLEDVIDADLVEALATDIHRLERALDIRPAANSFEGPKTLRIYNLLKHGPLYERIPVHGAVLPLVERVLDPGCLVSSLNSIDILPGEGPQLLHCDDQLLPIARPHPALVCNSIWALTDFTVDNGATRIVPGSHRAAQSPEVAADLAAYRRLVKQTAEATPVCMRRGSVLVYNGSLWHAGGPNRTAERRLAVAMNYCAGYIRQQENQFLGIPREQAMRFAPRLQELIGYSIYQGLIGHVDKTHPAAVLGRAAEAEFVWDTPYPGTRR